MELAVQQRRAAARTEAVFRRPPNEAPREAAREVPRETVAAGRQRLPAPPHSPLPLPPSPLAGSLSSFEPSPEPSASPSPVRHSPRRSPTGQPDASRSPVRPTGPSPDDLYHWGSGSPQPSPESSPAGRRRAAQEEAATRAAETTWRASDAGMGGDGMNGGGGGMGGGGGGMGGGGMGGGVGGSSYRDVKEVTCFRCWQTGHYANNCPNPKVPPPPDHPEAKNRAVY